jgi:hypothetical protein
VEEYTRDASDPSRLDPASRRVVLTLDHETTQAGGVHFGGDLAFDSTGALLVSTGDSDAEPVNGVALSVQDPNDRRGKILRIDPLGDAYPSDPTNNYAPASGNPDLGGDPAVWALGLRNPFKMHQDSDGTLYIGDVGESAFGEVNLGLAGANYGWSALEGAEPGPGGLGALGPAGLLVDPYFAYAHDLSPLPSGRSLTGGVVYRGDLEALYGQYLFGDFVTGEIWSIPAAPTDDPLEPISWLDEDGNVPFARVLEIAMGPGGAIYISEAYSSRIWQVTGAVNAIPLPPAGLALGAALLLLWRRKRASRCAERLPLSA